MVALTVPGRRTVTVIRRERLRDPDDDTKWARDERGDPVYGDTTLEVGRCSVQPGGPGSSVSSSERQDQGRERVSTLWTIYAPLTFPAGPIDAVEFDGERYEVQGEPERWEHPRLGHVVVTVRRASG